MPKGNWSLICHSKYGDKGELCVLRASDTGFAVKQVKLAAASGLDLFRRPVFLGLNSKDQVLLLDPVTKKTSVADSMPADAFPMYAYRDTANQRLWFVSDGDEETGHDPVSCGSGAPVHIIPIGSKADVQSTLCVGRGHHVASFIEPSDSFPKQKKLVFLTHLISGNAQVLGNDETDQSTYLKPQAEINFCEPEKEKDGITGVPNNSFPHGLVYSKATGKVYNLNNGYGTIAVVDPNTAKIEARIPLKGCSNLLESPCSRYVLGKGADRKSDPNHVIGKLAVVDVMGQKEVTTLTLPDFYPSCYRFSADGRKLYVTSAATGKGAQHDNLKIDVLQIYDATKIPSLTLLKEIKVGKADVSRRPIAFHWSKSQSLVFVPNPSEGSITVVDGNTDNVIETIKISSPDAEEMNFSYWEMSVYGA